ncbi:MAG: DUF2911 domain-containing protein [Lewinella sp.]|jgi:hypothetical protein|nr:DUF2911 domain-containing protein [Lewinella sp.]
MRKQLFTLAVAIMALLCSTGLSAQVTTPSASPTVKMETMIGMTDFHATYSRPGMKGRDLFTEDGLVPTGEIWRTGANSATKFTFGDDVTIMGKEVKAGDYAILTKPMGDNWEVMMFPYESGSWNSYVEKTPGATVTIPAKEMGMTVETFTIETQNHTMEGADVVIMWGNTMAAIPVKTNAKKQVMDQIDRVMAGPSMDDFYQAASFLSGNGENEKALEYITKANKMGGDDARYWMVRRQGLIQEAMGMEKEATDSFTKSMQLAEKAGNMDYVRMNKKSLGM